MPADKDTLKDILALVADTFKKDLTALQEGKKAADPRLLASAVKFLGDQRMTVDLLTNDAGAKLAKVESTVKLPFPTEEEKRRGDDAAAKLEQEEF